jgi:hypothetical protein
MTPKQMLQSLYGHASRSVPLYRRYGPPVACREGGRTGETASGQRRPAEFRRENEARSASNAWFSSGFARNSLIVERTTTTTYRRFATSREVFAINIIFSPAAVAPFSSLSKSLKEREKESEEERKLVRADVPRVETVLPSIADAAYFLSHVLRRSKTPDAWLLMAVDPLEIKVLHPPGTVPMYPRLALRVAPHESLLQDNQRQPVRCCRSGLS